MYSINFSATKRRFCLSLHYNGANSCYLFINGVEIIKFKAKDSEIIPNVLCLGNVSKDFSISNMKKKQGYMELCMILVGIMVLIQSVIY